MSCETAKWLHLPFEPKQLQLKGTLNGGQSFRWKHADNEWIGVFQAKLWRIKEHENGLQFTVTEAANTAAKKQKLHVDKDEEFVNCLRDYFHLDFDLTAHYSQWCKADELFNSVSEDFYGIRMLRQEVVENIFAFICSSNNHINRISSLVEKLARFYGRPICEYKNVTYYAFPTIEELNQDGVEAKLRGGGFGYRAAYIAKTVKAIAERGGAKWVAHLQGLPYTEARRELMSLTGIGRKVADCICLMSLGHLQAIPVDTHVHQIAKFWMKDTAKQKTITEELYKRIGDHFRHLYGPAAGWAQTVLFCADLKKFQAKD